MLTGEEIMRRTGTRVENEKEEFLPGIYVVGLLGKSRVSELGEADVSFRKFYLSGV